MAPSVLTLLVIWITLISPSVSRNSKQQVLRPHIENLAENKRITATSTCGEDVDEPEQYCNLVGVDPKKFSQTNEAYVIKGQVGYFSYSFNISREYSWNEIVNKHISI